MENGRNTVDKERATSIRLEFDSAGPGLCYVIYHPPHIKLRLIAPALSGHVDSKSKADDFMN